MFEKDKEEFNHEYKTVYDIYIKMFDDILYKKLKDQGFSDEEITDFIGSFDKHKKLYKDCNEAMVDLLFALTNFENFTNAMKASKE